MEEFQECLSREHVDQFTRLLALSRFKRVSLWFLNQQPSQIAEISPHLLRVLRTNTDIQMCFNSNIDDAKAFKHALSVPAGMKERDVVARITRLPKQQMYLWVRQTGIGAQLVHSPLLDMTTLENMAGACPEETKEAICRGIVAQVRGVEKVIPIQPDISPVPSNDEGRQFPRIG